jgi:hypothetical protein
MTPLSIYPRNELGPLIAENAGQPRGRVKQSRLQPGGPDKARFIVSNSYLDVGLSVHVLVAGSAAKLVPTARAAASKACVAASLRRCAAGCSLLVFPSNLVRYKAIRAKMQPKPPKI